MEDNYFDDKLKGILESHPEFEPDQSALHDMRSRLQAIQKPKKRRSGFFFLIPLLLLPVLLGAGFFYKKYDHLSKQVHELNQQVSDIHQTLRIDTIIEKQIIHHYDTIHTVVYREKYIRDSEANENNFYQQSGFQPPLYYSNHLNSPPFLTPNIPDWSMGKSKNSLFTRTPGSSIFNPYLWNDAGAESATNSFKAANPVEPIGLQLIPIDRSDLDWVSELSDQIPEYKEGKTKTAYYFVPTGFTFGADYKPYVFTFNDFGSTGKSYGLNGAIEFPGGRSLEVGAFLLRTGFEIKEDSGLFDLFPIVEPTDPSDVLHELKGNFRYLEIPIILRQRFRENRDLKPFISAGFVAYKPIAHEFVYEYIDGTGEYKLSNTLKNGVFSVDNLRLGLGAEYNLGKHLSALSELQYQHGFSLNTNEYYKLKYFALNIGVRYKM